MGWIRKELEPRRTVSRGLSHINVGGGERMLSVAGGGVLLALAAIKRGVLGWVAGLAGAGLVLRGVSGHCALNQALGRDTSKRRPIRVERAVTINRPADDLYRFFRNFENLPRFMDHLREVRVLDERRSHWVARAPVGTQVEWDAEIIREEPGHVIVWRSLPGADVPNNGAVRFDAQPGERGTIVRVTLAYDPPGGRLGAAVAALFGEDPAHQIEEDLRHFKQLMETGEIPLAMANGHGKTMSQLGGAR